ncbi:MAG: pyruvate dehydrogenase complex dihydrolipoyllysine-residue acetyltransferase, partial [Planctomycetota bacterium]
MVADIEQIRAAVPKAPSLAPAPPLPAAPPGCVLPAPPGGVLARPMAPPTWGPEATATAQPRPSTGW